MLAAADKPPSRFARSIVYRVKFARIEKIISIGFNFNTLTGCFRLASCWMLCTVFPDSFCFEVGNVHHWTDLHQTLTVHNAAPWTSSWNLQQTFRSNQAQHLLAALDIIWQQINDQQFENCNSRSSLGLSNWEMIYKRRSTKWPISWILRSP